MLPDKSTPPQAETDMPLGRARIPANWSLQLVLYTVPVKSKGWVGEGGGHIILVHPSLNRHAIVGFFMRAIACTAPVDHLCHVRYALGKACGPSRNLRHRLLATLANKRDEASGIGVQSALHAVDSRASPNVRHRKEPQRQHARGAPLSWEQSFARRPQAAEEVK